MDDFVADGIFIDASPERVFAALIDPEEVLEWLDAREASIGAGPRGEYAVLRDDGLRLSGTIETFEPGRELAIGALRVETAGETRDGMTLRFTLDRVDYGVWITVRQEHLDTGPGAEVYARDARKLLVQATVALKRWIEQI
jgi:uncharacterized protein YndB with AHSA1/START domain